MWKTDPDKGGSKKASEKLSSELSAGIESLAAGQKNLEKAVKSSSGGKLQQKIAANGDLMKRLGIRGTPGIIYKNAKDEITIFQGAARNDKLVEVLGPKPK